jgi:hypothetical protein
MNCVVHQVSVCVRVEIWPECLLEIVHAEVGSQISGAVESIREMMPMGRRETTPWRALVAWTACGPTVRLLESSWEKENVTLLGVNLDALYLPSVRLPRTFFSR